MIEEKDSCSLSRRLELLSAQTKHQPSLSNNLLVYSARCSELEAKVEELDALLSTDGGYYSGILKGRKEQRERDISIAGKLSKIVAKALQEQED